MVTKKAPTPPHMLDLVKLKRQAFTVKQTTGCIHGHALQQIARNHGYNTWESLLAAVSKAPMTRKPQGW